MKYLSVCSGVEAASQAWQPLGWEAIAFSEIEPFPCAVLASRFPNVPNLGDMSKIHYNQTTRELTNGTTRIVCPDGIDLIVGGTPCQSFSVAGKRAGLEGASGLAYHYARLLGEIQPRWFVWENVPGSLSSVTYGDQRDFNFLLQQFAIGGDAGLGIRYNLCWRVLDTQYVRVELFPRAIPQRRRRVFVVGHLAAECGGGCEVLLEPEGVRGNPPPRRVKGQGVTGDPAAGFGGADGEKRNAISFKAGQSSRGGLGVDEGACQTMQSKMSALEPTVAIRTANDDGEGIAFIPYGTRLGADKNGVAKTMTRIDEKFPQCVTVKTANGVDCLCPEQPQAHRVYGANGQAVAIAYDGYNQTAHDECTFHLRTSNGSEGDDRMVKVAIGIGRDAFNSGKNAQMAQSISTEVQPPIIAKGPGGVCTNGEPRTGRM